MFKCTTIEDDLRFYGDLELICYQGIHMNFTVFLGLPMILIWVLGIPLFGITFLTLRRKEILRAEFKKNFLILYQGLKSNRYYWEFVNVLRKVFILLINVLIPGEMWQYRIMFAIVFLLMFLRLQTYLKPYKKQLHNDLEQREIICSIFTLYSGIYFNSGSLSFFVDIGIIIFLAVVNYYFFSALIFCFLRIPHPKYEKYA